MNKAATYYDLTNDWLIKEYDLSDRRIIYLYSRITNQYYYSYNHMGSGFKSEIECDIVPAQVLNAFKLFCMGKNK